MGYYDAGDLPVYDHLASEYCVVDRWFSSVPGATWPNRLYAVTGQAAGRRDDISPPIYSLPSFMRYLDEHQVDWRWYSFDPATLRAVDPAYRLSNHDHFAFVDARKLTTAERAVGELDRGGPRSWTTWPTAGCPGLLDRSAVQGSARARPGLQRRPSAVRRVRRPGPGPHDLPRAEREPEPGQDAAHRHLRRARRLLRPRRAAGGGRRRSPTSGASACACRRCWSPPWWRPDRPRRSCSGPTSTSTTPR